MVPVNEEAGQAAFDGIIVNGVLWDAARWIRNVHCRCKEAAEQLLKEGFTPNHDMYLAFAGMRKSPEHRKPVIVETLRARGVTSAMS